MQNFKACIHALTIVCLLLKHVHAMTMVLLSGLPFMHQEHANQLSIIIMQGNGGNDVLA